VAPTRKQERAKVYKVASGDTLESIANKFNISLDTILWTNDISSDEILRVGMELRIPPVSGVVHKVVNGDTISEIARFYGVDADDIVSINGLKNVASIRTGMDLMIPGAIKRSPKIPATTKPNEKPLQKTLTPVPTVSPNLKPTVVDSTTGLKSRYTIKYTGLSR
jgi:lysostaphin